MPGDRLLSYASVCEILDCSDDTVRRLVRLGMLPRPKKYKHLGLRFRAEDVYRYLYTAAEEEGPEEQKPNVKGK